MLQSRRELSGILRMERVIGVVPAGGRARRIHGFFKEMMPIGINESDKSKFVVSSERILEGILQAGASSVHFLLSAEKSFIAEYYARQELFTGRVNFNYISKEIERTGLPYAIDNLYNQTREFDYVVMGFPDNFIEPPESFKIVLQFCRNERADLALGLYKTDSRNRGGYIQFDARTKDVRSHVDHTSSGFPAGADNLWAIACWSSRFTEFIHDFLSSRTGPRYSDLPFGVLIDAALSPSSGLRTMASFVDEERGFHWDIADPEKYFDLLRQLYSSGGARGFPTAKASRCVFIGHGHAECWKTLRDFLRDRLKLEWEEFNRVSPIGKYPQQRLKEMMDAAGFAFLVMTAEEEGQARNNVIHEIGYAQACLGTTRVAILVEEGCDTFSNIDGLTVLRFPKGDLMSKSDEIRKVLEDRGLIGT